MQVEKTPLEGLVIVTPDVFGDARGCFYESYNADKFAAIGLPTTWLQDNHSVSAKGVLRGLHFRLPHGDMAKLVRATKGRVWDVAVDLRASSPTYKQWFGLELSAENKKMLYIPEGFAHGFYCLEDAEFQYKCSKTYVGELEGTVLWNDPDLQVGWPLDGEPIVSSRDAAAARLADLDLAI